jgi:hypothetical protein
MIEPTLNGNPSQATRAIEANKAPAAIGAVAVTGGGLAYAGLEGASVSALAGGTSQVAFKALTSPGSLDGAAVAGNFVEGAVFGAALGPLGGAGKGASMFRNTGAIAKAGFAGSSGKTEGGMLNRKIQGASVFDSGAIKSDAIQGGVGGGFVGGVRGISIPGRIAAEETGSATVPTLVRAVNKILRNDIEQRLSDNY